MSNTYDLYVGTADNYTVHFDKVNIIKDTLEEVQTVDFTANKLSVDQFEPVVFSVYYDAQSFAPKGYDLVETSDGKIFCTNKTFTNIETLLHRGDFISLYVNGELKGKYHLDELESVSEKYYTLKCTSGIGMLDTTIYKGGLFEISDVKSFGDVLADILGGTLGELGSDFLYPITGGVFDCYVEADLCPQIVSGLITYGNAREALHNLMLAQCAMLMKDTDGDIIFSYLYGQNNPPVIDENVIYLGSKKINNSPATRVEVTEHTYLNLGTADELVTLFDGTVEGTVTDKVVPFNEPCHDLYVEGTLTINESSATYANITGSGKLLGYKYTHSRQILGKGEQVTQDNVISIPNCTLINPTNSFNIVDRIYDYYANAKTTEVSFVWSDERCGRKYQFVDDRKRDYTGYVSELVRNGSGNIKATAKVITNYEPTGQPNNYSRAITLTGSGTITIVATPEEEVLTGQNKKLCVNRFRAILVGGGSGGQGGTNGTAGNPIKKKNIQYGYLGEDYAEVDVSTATGGQGGQGGLAGQAGKVLTADYDEVEVGDVFNYSCGTGGNGGTNGAQGQAGTHTTFGEYDTDNGAVPSGGIVNLFTGDVLARPAANGVSGANGGSYNTSDTSQKPIAANGSSVTYQGVTYTGGKGGNQDEDRYSEPGEYSEENYAIGGGGGGAAKGSNGGNSTASAGHSASGGKGANGATVPAATYGSAGAGGNGGGGGGAGGYLYRWLMFRNYPSLGQTYVVVQITIQGVGSGGTASAGGKGGNGCILIYC